MQVVPQIIDCYQFVFLAGNDTADIFLKFIIVFGFDEISPSFDCEHDMDVNLRVGIGHLQKMPLLTELGNIFQSILQRCQPYGLLYKNPLTG